MIDNWYHFLLHLHLKLNMHVFSGRRRLEVRCHGARQVILIQSYIAKVNTYPFSGLDISQIYHRNCRQDSPVDFQLCLRRRHLRDHPGCSQVTPMLFLIPIINQSCWEVIIFISSLYDTRKPIDIIVSKISKRKLLPAPPQLDLVEQTFSYWEKRTDSKLSKIREGLDRKDLPIVPNPTPYKKSNPHPNNSRASSIIRVWKNYITYNVR